MEQKAINSLFNRFSGMSILVIGDVMIDSYIWGKVDRISPEAPVPVVSITKRENRPGGAANVALNILSMGAVPLVCSVIGKDEKGELFMQLMKNYGMCMDGIIMDGIRKTTSKTRVISGGQQLLRVDEELTSPLVKQLEEELMERIGKMIDSKKPAAIIFQDYDKGVITETLISGTIKKAKSMGIPVTVDPKKRNFNYFSGASLFKPNFKELTEGTKTDVEKGNTAEIEKIVNEYLKKYNINYMLLTLSEKGVFISDGEKSYSIPSEARDITDVSGAGDTVISVATLCLAAGAGMEDIARISNLAGGLVCEKVGVVPVEKGKLKKECERLLK